MRRFLRKSISSLNQNKLHGLLAEVSLRQHLEKLGYKDQVSSGGWIARSTRDGTFGEYTAAFFPQPPAPGRDYPSDGEVSDAPAGLHSVAAVLYQAGIQTFHCGIRVGRKNEWKSVSWRAKRLGIPTETSFSDFPASLTGFVKRSRRYGYLRHKTPATLVPEHAVPDEFAKEHLRVAFQSEYFAEISDIDAIFWGKRHTYPVEVKEKTVAEDDQVGPYFGLDFGPFVKLAFYAARQGNLKSLFVVREIADVESRRLKKWWFIRFEDLADVASWTPRPGGASAFGGGSVVARIPRKAFAPLNVAALAEL